MAACCQQPAAVDYISTRPAQRPQNTTFTTSPFLWEQRPYTDAPLTTPEICDSSDSTLASPVSPPAVTFPNLYALPKELDQDIKDDQAFDLGSFDDWVGWDDPADNALSPTTIDFFPELKMEPTSPNLRQIDLNQRPQYQNSSFQNGMEDSAAVFGNDRMEEPLFQTSEQPRENLYSTPLSWSPPTAITNIRNSEPYNLTPVLSPRSQSRLIAQAMPSRAHKYPSSPSSSSSPESEQLNSLKRKSTSYASDDEDEDSFSPQPTTNGHARHPPGKKTAHNMIEKRYRTNLNDKIAALRESVPSLRVVTKRNSRGEEVAEDLQGLTPAHKLNKATVLSRAAEYISHLERRNKVLTKENTALKSRIEAFEILIMAREPEQEQQQQIQSQQHPIRN